jgi:hypothetical protein
MVQKARAAAAMTGCRCMIMHHCQLLHHCYDNSLYPTTNCGLKTQSGSLLLTQVLLVVECVVQGAAGPQLTAPHPARPGPGWCGGCAAGGHQQGADWWMILRLLLLLWLRQTEGSNPTCGLHQAPMMDAAQDEDSKAGVVLTRLVTGAHSLRNSRRLQAALAIERGGA